MSGKYLGRFQEALKDNAGCYGVGDVLLVEKLPEKERRTKSGIIVDVPGSPRSTSSLTAGKAHFVRIIATGQGYYDDETKESVPLDVSPGDIVLVGELSIKWFSSFGSLEEYEADTIGIMRESEVLWVFKGEEGYTNTFCHLNAPSKEPT